MEKHDMDYWKQLFDDWKNILEEEDDLKKAMRQLKVRKKLLIDSLEDLTLWDLSVLEEIFIKNRTFVVID